MTLVLGIDPGIATTGYGVVREERDGSLVAVAFGVIETPKEDAFPVRLQALRGELRALIERWKPDECGIEAIFFATNARTIIPVAQARGVALLTLADAGLPLGDTPRCRSNRPSAATARPTSARCRRWSGCC
jgi:crossover junction endodeoxyribonuclease RuvC